MRVAFVPDCIHGEENTHEFRVYCNVGTDQYRDDIGIGIFTDKGDSIV